MMEGQGGNIIDQPLFLMGLGSQQWPSRVAGARFPGYEIPH